MIPTTGQPVRLRATGSLQVRCVDPGAAVAQFVGLPFDRVNDGVLRSVSRSVERMLARLLTRRVVMAGTPLAVTDPGCCRASSRSSSRTTRPPARCSASSCVRIGHLAIYADDGSRPWQRDGAGAQRCAARPSQPPRPRSATSLETVRAPAPPTRNAERADGAAADAAAIDAREPLDARVRRDASAVRSHRGANKPTMQGRRAVDPTPPMMSPSARRRDRSRDRARRIRTGSADAGAAGRRSP